ncbi:MAG: hypothetical protein AAFV43_17155 [Planctomycetota bacterium]
MTRHADRVESARMVAVVGVRLIAVYFVCFGLVTASQYISSMMMYASPRFSAGDEWAWMLVGPAVSIVLGLVLWFGAARFARAVIRVGKRVCPGCGYALEGRPVERCSECGLFLGDGFMDPPVDSGDGPDPR